MYKRIVFAQMFQTGPMQEFLAKAQSLQLYYLVSKRPLEPKYVAALPVLFT